MNACAVCAEPVLPGEGTQARPPLPAIHTHCARRALDENLHVVITLPGPVWPRTPECPARPEEISDLPEHVRKPRQRRGGIS